MNKFTKHIIEATFFAFFSVVLISGVATVIWIFFDNN